MILYFELSRTTWVVSKKVFWLKETSVPVHVKLAQNVDDTIIQDVRVSVDPLSYKSG